MFNKRILGLAIALATVLSLGLFLDRITLANDADNRNDEQQKMEKEFFQNQESANTLEIRLAKLAEQRSTDPQVQQTARMIQQDHEQANQSLKQIADQHHIDISMGDLNPVDQACFDEISKKEGEIFTRAYVFSQVGAHAENELVLAYHANMGHSDACREYASQTLPKVQEHLHALEQIGRPMAGLSASMAEPAAAHMTPAHQ
jgi:putative membrane protein